MKATTKVARRLGIEFVPYTSSDTAVRRGNDYDANDPSSASRIKRGRWRTFRSVARYEKAGRMLQRYRLLPQRLRDHAEACAENLRAVVLGEQLATRAREPLSSSTSTRGSAG